MLKGKVCECVGESVTIGAGVPRFAFAQFVCSGRDTATKRKKKKKEEVPAGAFTIQGVHGYQVGF